MIDTTTHQEKFAILKEWLPNIINDVRKDLKKDHLKKAPGFLKQFLNGKPVNKLTNDEIVEGYIKALNSEEGEKVAEFITNRWLLKNSDAYYYFEKELVKINPDITQITKIENDVAHAIIKGATEEIGAVNTYLFSQLNSVAFSKEVFKQLEQEAKKAVINEEKDEQLESLESIKNHYETQMARITDRYEKKLSSLERKYVEDTEMLKKQIANLQRKLTV